MGKEIFNSLIFNILLSVLFAITISYIDLHNDEVQSAVILLLIFSFIMGYKDPRRAWLYSIILSLSIIIGHFYSRLIGFVPKGPPSDNILWSFLSLIPSFIGGYSGVLMRILFKKSIS